MILDILKFYINLLIKINYDKKRDAIATLKGIWLD